MLYADYLNYQILIETREYYPEYYPRLLTIH